MVCGQPGRFFPMVRGMIKPWSLNDCVDDDDDVR